MREFEARWIGDVLRSEPDEELQPLIDLGASTPDFRSSRPHIDNNIYAPLRERGIQIVSVDLKDRPGVEIVGNILDEDVQARVRKLRPRSLLCCNILEHVTDREAFAKAVAGLVLPGGLLVVTVPNSYPYHLDPIDTYFRPTPDEILDLFPSFLPIKKDVIADTNFASDLRLQNQSVPLEVLRILAKSCIFRGGFKKSWSRLHRLKWLWKSYKVSVVAMRAP